MGQPICRTLSNRTCKLFNGGIQMCPTTYCSRGCLSQPLFLQESVTFWHKFFLNSSSIETQTLSCLKNIFSKRSSYFSPICWFAAFPSYSFLQQIFSDINIGNLGRSPISSSIKKPLKNRALQSPV